MDACSHKPLFSLAALLLALAVLSLSVGSSGYTLLDLFSGKAPLVILELRGSRTIAAIAAGAILGSAGLALQYILRNPLADPYLLGVSPAAFLVVTLYALIAPSLAAYYLSVTPVAVAGGLLGLALVALLSRLAAEAHTLILAGVAVATSLSGAAFALEYVAASKLGWNPAYAIFGGFAGVLPGAAMIVAAAAAALAALLAYMSHSLEALLYGDSVAILTGREPRRSRLLALLSTGLAVAVQTGYTGVIGFVGLIAPNAARRLLRCIEARRSLAASAMLGSLITLGADIASRLVGAVSAYGEIPAGALIALAGGAFLAALIARG